MSDPAKAVAAIRVLTQAGVQIAIDDFGTGFSSLAYLKHLDLHTLKIDRCFVKDITNNANDLTIVRSTLRMAHSLDLLGRGRRHRRARALRDVARPRLRHRPGLLDREADAGRQTAGVVRCMGSRSRAAATAGEASRRLRFLRQVAPTMRELDSGSPHARAVPQDR